MSTSHEALVAAYCGMKVLGLSIITDLESTEYDQDSTTDHLEIVEIANSKSKEIVKLLAHFLRNLEKNLNLLD